MKTEAVSAAFYTSPGSGKDYLRIQVLTIEALLHGTQVEMPPQHGPFREAQRTRPIEPEHLQLDL